MRLGRYEETDGQAGQRSCRLTGEGSASDVVELEPLPEGVLDTLRQVSTSTIATQLYKRGFRQPQLLGVRPLSEVADGFVGEAFTMRFIPMREDVDALDPYRSGNTLQWDAFEAVHPGARDRGRLLPHRDARPRVGTC